MDNNKYRRCNGRLRSLWTRARQSLYKPNYPLLAFFFCYLQQGLVPLIEWQWVPPLQSTSAASRDEGALGGWQRHYLCFWFVEMTEEGAKAKPFYNAMTYSRCSVRNRFLTLSQLVKPLRISTLFGFKKFKMDPKWTIQNLRKMPPKGSFHNNGWGILTTF